MKIIQLLTISGILLLHLQGTFARGKKNTELLSDPKIRRSPLFCPLKYELCLKHPKRGSNPTPDSCAQRIARKYLCSVEDIKRSYTEEEKKKFLNILGGSNQGSRSFGGGDEPMVDPEEVVDSGTEESSEETARLNPDALRHVQSQHRPIHDSPSPISTMPLSPDESHNSDESSSQSPQSAAITYRIVDVPVDTPDANPVDLPAAIPGDSPAAIPMDSRSVIAVDSPAAIPVDSPATALVDSPASAPVDSPASAPVDSPATSPVDSPASAPVDSPASAPVDSPVAISEDSKAAIPVDEPAPISDA